PTRIGQTVEQYGFERESQYRMPDPDCSFNKMVVKDLVGCSEAEALTRTVIKTLVDESDVVV
ncbi:MAG TPA: hypothetical protein PLD38_15300, partial [Pyrinomonadaceae bacterium]|nr:hypothetical protein [Pyrinomonadaceae bacterium]